MTSKKISTKHLDPDVKFLHLRYKDPNGNILATGGTTIAYRVADGNVSYAVAKCHYRDNYRKDLGRVKAHGRLLSKTAKTYVGTEDAFTGFVADSVDNDNLRVQHMAAVQGYDPTQTVLLFRKFNGKRKPALTEADALADLNGTPRPDNPSA